MANLQGLLAVPPKTTKSVEFGSFVRFIANNYDDEPSKYGEAVRDFGNLREATVVRTPDKHETGLDLLCRCACVCLHVCICVCVCVCVCVCRGGYPW